MKPEELLNLLLNSGDIDEKRKAELQELLEKSGQQTEGKERSSDQDSPEDVSTTVITTLPSTSSSTVQSAIISKKEEKHKMYYGVSREEFLTSLASDKKRLKLKDSKEGKRTANAPQPDRIPLPSIPEEVKQEYRAALKDSQQKKYRITIENPPSVCLFTVLNANGGLCTATITDNGSMYALGFGNSTIQVDALASEYLKTLKSSKELEELDNEGDEFSEEMYSNQDRPKSVSLLGHSGPVHSLSFSCEKRLLLSGSRDATIRLWNLEMRRNLVIYRPMAPVWEVQFCCRGYYFASSGADQTVSLWTTERLKPLRVFADPQDDVTRLDFHPNCNYIAGGCEDNSVKVWDVLTGNCVRTFIGHKGPIRGLKTSPCGRYLISASEDGSIAVWDMGQQKLVGVQECEPFEYNTPIVFSRDASVIAVGTPKYGLSFYSMEALTSNSTPTPLINPTGFPLFSYPTKRTSILDFHFTRKNTVVALGSFEQ